MRLVNHHYNMSYINWAFLIGAVLLFGTWVWAIWEDYSSPYKQWQREFYRVYEAQLRNEKENVWDREKRQQLRDYRNRIEQLKSRMDQRGTEEDELRKQLERFENIKIARQENRSEIAKRRYDAVAYQYQKATVRAIRNPTYEVPESLREKFNRLRKQYRQQQRKTAKMEERAEELRNKIEQKRQQINQLKTQVQDLTRQVNAIESEIKRIDDSWVNTILDAPLLNFIRPRTEIKQIQVEGLYTDYNFDYIPRQDFCKSCHMGIDKPAFQLDEDGDFEHETTASAFEDVFSDERMEVMKSVFRTHPNFDKIGSTSSKFPFSEYGCTGCHMGNGRALEFNRAAHTPSSEEERKEWEERYGWELREHWSWPMIQTKYLDASIPQFYNRENYHKIPDAGRVNEGHDAWVTYGCSNCHSVDGLNYQRKIGFSLKNIKSKLDRAWTRRWIERPSDFNSNARMPQVFHRFNLDDPEDRQKSTAVIHSITEYLYSQSDTQQLDPAPRYRGNADRGERLFKEVGCTGCHSMQTKGIETSKAGPDLSYVGSKLDRRWIYNWLKNPQEVWPETHMPDMKLTDREANDITEWLLQQKNSDWSAENFPTEIQSDTPLDRVLDQRIEEVARQFIGRTEGPRTTNRRIRELKQQARDRGIPERKRLARFVGSQSVDYFGCSSCHMIPGHDGYNRIGPSLDEIGTRGLHRLAFGFVDIPHTRQHFVEQKLKQPGKFDQGQVNGFLENLRMPKPNLDEDERQDLVAFVLSFRGQELIDESLMKRASPGQKFAARGAKLMNEYNCKGCHQLNSQSEIAGYLSDYYRKKQQQGEELEAGGYSFRSARGAAQAQLPPSLTNVGRRLDMDWLFDFLKNPDGPHGRDRIRTWQHVRMPQFHFSDEEVSTIARGLTYDGWGEIPPRLSRENKVPTEESVEVGQALFGAQCKNCHIAEGNQEFYTPQMTPNLNYIGNKFDYRGFLDWAGDPNSFVPEGVNLYRHQGMPGLRKFDRQRLIDILGYEPEGSYDTREKQLKAVRDYLFHHQLGTKSGE